MSYKTIDPSTVAKALENLPAFDLIDVRTPAEFESVRAKGARSFPLDRLDPKAITTGRAGKAEDPIYVICKSGGRSRKACEQLVAAGITNIVNVDGGTEAWEKAGLPVIRGERNALPLDRQVQMTAGLICLSGAILGFTVTPWFYLLSAMVGFGLTMAGLTGFCPMAILMGRMPWNQSKVTSCSTTQAGTCCSK